MTGFVKNILSKVAEEESHLEWVEEWQGSEEVETVNHGQYF